MTSMLATLALSTGLMGPAHADDVSLEGYAQALPQRGNALGAGVFVDSAGRTFLSADGRFGAGGALSDICEDPNEDRWWTGRATGGLDLFKGDGLDLTLGLFLGSAGSWQAAEPALSATAGFELGLGANIGNLSGRYRHANGFRGASAAHLTENEWRIGYTLGDKLTVFGQYVRFNPGDDVARGGYGMGLSMHM